MLLKEDHIVHKLTSVGHLQFNREVEVTNRIILEGLKIRIGQVKENWADELYSILWSYRTTPYIPIRETSFKLTFGTKAMILVKIDLSSTWMEHYDELTNSDK